MECVQALIQNERCDPNIQLSDGSTALHVAVHSTYTVYQQEIVQVLLENDKTDPNINDNTGQTPFHSAITSGKLNIVEALISSGKCRQEHNIHGVVESNKPQLLSALLKYLDNDCGINKKDDDGETALHKACREGKLECIRVFIGDERCDPNIQFSDGSTALHVAVSRHYTVYQQEVVQVLMESSRIDPNLKDKSGQTPLHIAVLRGVSCDVVKALVLHKICDPNIKNEYIMTPLQCAIASRKLDYVEVLISSGKCSYEHKSISDTFAFHRVADSNTPHIFSALLKDPDCNINEKDDNGETVLHKACRDEKLEYIRALIRDERCDPNIQLSDGNTALHVAVNRHFTVYQQEIVQCLLQSTNIDSNLKDSSGQTPLHIAVVRKHFEIAFLLFKHSTHKPNLQDNDGNTALHHSVGSLWAVELFLSDTSIDLNIQNYTGNTPLHEAVIRGASCDVVNALVLHKSCAPNIVNKAKITPLQCAITSESVDAVEVLISSDKYSQDHIVKSINGTHILHRVVLTNKLQLLQTLLKYESSAIYKIDCNGEASLLLKSEKIDPNIRNSRNQTPLHLAIRKDIDITDVILKHSECNPNAQDIDGNTPLHLAVVLKSPSYTKHLLSHPKIDVNIQNSAGNTPLHEAVIKGTCSDVVKALVHHKNCDVLIKDKKGKTPLQLTMFYESKLDIMEALLASDKLELQDTIEDFREKMWIFNKALLHDHPILVKKCIEVGCSVNNADALGETPLHIVCRKGYKESCVLLLQCKEINVVAQDQYGNAPIHIACQHLNEKCLEMLLDHKMCNPNQTNHEGDTPLHILCSSRQPSENMIRMLLSMLGINHECVNYLGLTPIELVPKSNTSRITISSYDI